MEGYPDDCCHRRIFIPRVNFLKSFTNAWNDHDIEGIRACMTEDCVFVSSSGSRFEGRDVVRECFVDVLESFPDVHFWSRQAFCQW